MKKTILTLVCVTALILAVSIFVPNRPDIDQTKPQGMVHYARSGQYLNGTKTWTITQIDSAFFSYLDNYTIIKLEVTGNVTAGNVGSIYLNDHFVGNANASQEHNEWNVPVAYCGSTSVIKVVSGGWNVRSVDLLFYVEFSKVQPWWKQNLLIIVLTFLSLLAIAAIFSVKRILRWVQT